jgi:hypothetical protein
MKAQADATMLQDRDDARAAGGASCLPDDEQPVTDAHRAWMRRKIDEGLESARQGRLLDGGAVFDRILRKARPDRT